MCTYLLQAVLLNSLPLGGYSRTAVSAAGMAPKHPRPALLSNGRHTHDTCLPADDRALVHAPINMKQLRKSRKDKENPTTPENLGKIEVGLDEVYVGAIWRKQRQPANSDYSTRTHTVVRIFSTHVRTYV